MPAGNGGCRGLEDAILSCEREGVYPFHMPGHKRNPEALTIENAEKLDVTETDDFDDLHHPSGHIAAMQEKTAALWGAEESRLLVNGSSCGVIAALCSALHPGDTVLFARNSHKSAYHALELSGARARYLYPPLNRELGICGSISPALVEREIRALKGQAKAVFLTSPTYEGVLSDIAGIAEKAHRHGIPLIVDEAHGAHLGFSDAFSGGAVKAGADLVVQSLHKTLPALTQTAVLHIRGPLADRRRLAHYLQILQSSSPSYVLMCAAGRCLAYLENAETVFSEYEKNLEDFRKISRTLTMFSFPPAKELQAYKLDPGKLLIDVRKTGLSGVAVLQLLRKEFALQLEMASPTFVLAMTSPADTPEGFLRLMQALLAIEDRIRSSEAGKEIMKDRQIRLFPEETEPVIQMQASEALELPAEEVPLHEAAGRVAAAYAGAYPPGIPLLVPGEEITGELTDRIRMLISAGAAVYGVRGSEGDWMIPVVR